MILLVVGIFSAFLGSLMGLGGGFILIPILNLALGFSMKDAVFLSLSSVFFLSVLQNITNREIIRENRAPLLRLSFFAVIGSAIAAWIGTRTPDAVISIAFSLFVIGFGIFFWRSSSQALAQVSSHIRKGTADLLMITAGISSGFFGIGGGIITVPVLHHFMLFPMKDCARLSFFVQFFATGVGLLVYYHTRKEVIYQIPPSTLIFLLSGAIIGMFLSRRIKTTNAGLKKLFAVLLIAIGLWKILYSLQHFLYA